MCLLILFECFSQWKLLSMKIHEKALIHENMHESVHASEAPGFHIKSWCWSPHLPPHPPCMHITLLPPPNPPTGIKLESADNRSNIVHTTWSILGTFDVNHFTQTTAESLHFAKETKMFLNHPELSNTLALVGDIHFVVFIVCFLLPSLELCSMGIVE